jgi:hypothetical protein
MHMVSIRLLSIGLFVGATAITGCASTAGWGPAPAAPPASMAANAPSGAPRFVATSGMRLTKKQGEVKVPPNIRVQDCAIVAISSPSRFACDGKVYTSFELARARAARETGGTMHAEAEPKQQTASAGH